MARLLLDLHRDLVGILKTGIRFAPRILIGNWPIENNYLIFNDLESPPVTTGAGKYGIENWLRIYM